MKALFYSIIVSAALAFSAEAVLVDGYCYLQEQTNHQDTKVKFQADSPSAVTDSTYTNADGYYQINLSLGVYDVYFSHQGYFDEQILDQLLSTATTLPNVTLTGGGIPISGPLNGILAGDTTYIVISDISVLSGSSLII
nr:carboxypeptidase regulatory-like domain-containing protein [FCB group bacterium]